MKLTFSEFIAVWSNRILTYREERVGQAFFNALVECNPSLAERIRGTWLDPFYDTARLNSTVRWVAENWPKEDGHG